MPPAWRRTQVAKGAVCKTAMRRFEPARRLHPVRGLTFSAADFLFFLPGLFDALAVALWKHGLLWLCENDLPGLSHSNLSAKPSILLSCVLAASYQRPLRLPRSL